jgi:CDP-diacylglycerol--glycerol-3-phosphate 3-phosphatidyltransferase
MPSIEPQGYSISWPESNKAPSPLINPTEFRQRSTLLLAPTLRPNLAHTTQSNPTSSTVVYPLIQFTPLLKPDSSTELPALEVILNSLASQPLRGSSWTFTAGYFNMTPSVRRLLLKTNPTRGTVIAASPWANGFFGSAGISGMLPDAYTLLSKRFVDAVRRRNLSSQITLKEWRRGTIGEPEGWTYHAKGLWVTLPGELKPTMTIVGSSNYTKRSYNLDLEANVLIVTRDTALQNKLAEEESWLQEYSKPVTSTEYEKPERHVGIKVRLAMWAVRVLGGAL